MSIVRKFLVTAALAASMVATAAEAEPVLVEAAARSDPPRLRRVISHLQQVAGAVQFDHERPQGTWMSGAQR